MNETAQHVLSAYVQGHQVSDRWRCAPGRRSKADPSMRRLFVVMIDVGPKDMFKVPSAEDDRPVKAFGGTVALAKARARWTYPSRHVSAITTARSTPRWSSSSAYASAWSAGVASFGSVEPK